MSTKTFVRATPIQNAPVLTPDEYYSFYTDDGHHCRRCNEILTGKKVELYIDVREGTWHTTPTLNDNDEPMEISDIFGERCAKWALKGR